MKTYTFRFIKRAKNKFRLNKGEQLDLYKYIIYNEQVWNSLDMQLKDGIFRDNLRKNLMDKMREGGLSRLDFCVIYNIISYIDAINSGEVAL